MITLEELVHLFPTGLRPVEPGRVGRALVRGVHVSELADPTPYLEGGELLLTTGIPFTSAPATVAAYVERLAARGVVALGLGLGAGTDAVPSALAAACREVGLPLLVVPTGVPFQLIARGYWDVVARQERADLSSRLRVQTALAEATATGSLPLLLDRLVGGVGGWAAYVSFDGEVAAVSPDSARDALAGIVQQLPRLRGLGPHSGASFTQDGEVVLGHAVMDGSRAAGFLAVGIAAADPRPDRNILLTAAALLGTLARTRALAAAADFTAAPTIAALLLRGDLPAARAVVALHPRTPALPPVIRLILERQPASGVPRPARVSASPYRVVAVPLGMEEGPGGAPAPVEPRGAEAILAEEAAAVTIVPPRGARGFAEAILAEEAAAVTIVEPRGARELAEAMIADGAGAVLVSDPVPLERIATVLPRLTRELAAVPAGQVRTLEHDSAQAVAADRVERLRASAPDLLPAVVAYLRHRGHWEPAARELGVHRNSLRHRIAAASALLAADLDDPDTTADLWHALRTASLT